jgi:o-succinylbenzoate synthase
VSGAARLAVQAGIDGIDAIVPFRVPLTTRFRGVTERHGLLLHGPHGWGEWSPFDEYDDRVAAVWLDAAISSACTSPPPALRDAVPVNVTVPAVDAGAAQAMVMKSGCTTAKVKVAESGTTIADDVARVRAVRAALGPDGRIRVDANAAWSVDEAVEALGRLEEAAGGLEYAEQPCATIGALAEVRARTGVRIAADEAIRRDHADPSLVRDAVDVAVIKVQPSGGVHAALALIERLGLPAVVSSALDTSVGLAAGVQLAAHCRSSPTPAGSRRDCSSLTMWSSGRCDRSRAH